MATRKSAQRNMVLVEAKQRCSCRFIAPPARSIFTLPGVDGKRSSSSARIFLPDDAVVALLLPCEAAKNPIPLGAPLASEPAMCALLARERRR